MKCGIVGLPNVGKSTLFNCLSNAKALAANYPFATIEPNVGRVAVPDNRLKILASIGKSEKIIPSFMRKLRLRLHPAQRLPSQPLQAIKETLWAKRCLLARVFFLMER